MRITFLSLLDHYNSIKKEIDLAVDQVFQSGQFVGGVTVKQFEKNFADYHGMKHAISTGNGTDSLFGKHRDGIGHAIGAADRQDIAAFGCKDRPDRHDHSPAAATPLRRILNLSRSRA